MWERGDPIRKAKYIKHMEKELQGLEEGPKAKILLNSFKATLKKYQIGKLRAIMEYMDSGLKNSPPSMTDWLSKRIDTNKQTYANGWPKEKPPWSRKTSEKQPP